MDKIMGRLNDLKSELDKAKAEKFELVGARKQHLSQLKENFGADTVEEGQKLLAGFEAEIGQLESDIGLAFGKLEKEYEW